VELRPVRGLATIWLLAPTLVLGWACRPGEGGEAAPGSLKSPADVGRILCHLPPRRGRRRGARMVPDPAGELAWAISSGLQLGFDRATQYYGKTVGWSLASARSCPGYVGYRPDRLRLHPGSPELLVHPGRRVTCWPLSYPTRPRWSAALR